MWLGHRQATGCSTHCRALHPVRSHMLVHSQVLAGSGTGCACACPGGDPARALRRGCSSVSLRRRRHTTLLHSCRVAAVRRQVSAHWQCVCTRRQTYAVCFCVMDAVCLCGVHATSCLLKPGPKLLLTCPSGQTGATCIHSHNNNHTHPAHPYKHQGQRRSRLLRPSVVAPAEHPRLWHTHSAARRDDADTFCRVCAPSHRCV